MAKYTITLCDLINSGYDIGLDDYPIPSFADETWRSNLNKKIINHFYYQEIGCTAPDLWKLMINNIMREIMPIKCLQYEALRNLASPFISIQDTYSETHGDQSTSSQQNHSTSNAGSNSSNSYNDYSVNVSSQTPGQMLNIEDDISNNTYADRAGKSKTNGTSGGNSQSNSTNDANGNSTTNSNGTITSNREIIGVHGKSQAQLYKEYIESVNNIDLDIIRELATCFMGIF